MLVSELVHKLQYFPSDAKVVIGRKPIKQVVIMVYRPQKDKEKREIGPGRLYIYNELEVK